MIELDMIAPNAVRVTVPHALSADDFAHLAPEIDRIIRQQGKISLLVDATHFDGWENMAAFERHMGFIKVHQRSIERAAVIARHAWQYWLVGLFKMFVHPEVRIYEEEQAQEARRWISEGPAKISAA